VPDSPGVDEFDRASSSIPVRTASAIGIETLEELGMTNFADLEFVDLEPAAWRLAHLVGSVPNESLAGPTPCPDYSVGDLVDHVGGLAFAFTMAARKTSAGNGLPGRLGDASRLGDDWRVRIPRDLAELAEAWRDPTAWTGITEAGGVELPGEVAGLVALNELVVHGWDLALATRQTYDCDPSSLGAVHSFLTSFAPPPSPDRQEGPFGPVVEVGEDAVLLARVIGLSGRDPVWVP
jgi:uncharacterized protein (TIGR03086 family)